MHVSFNKNLSHKYVPPMCEVAKITPFRVCNYSIESFEDGGDCEFQEVDPW